MKGMKKGLALLLTLALCVGCCPTTSFAAELSAEVMEEAAELEESASGVWSEDSESEEKSAAASEASDDEQDEAYDEAAEVPSEEVSSEATDNEEKDVSEEESSSEAEDVLTEEPSSEEIVTELEIPTEETEQEADETIDGITVPEEETPVFHEGSLSDSDGIYEVSVTYNADAGIPEGAAVSVRELKEQEAAYQEAKRKVQPEEEAGFAALDITILDAEGNEVEPEAAVEVEIRLGQLPEGVGADSEITVSHIDESTGTAEAVVVADTAEETEGTVILTEDTAVVSFSVDSFSTFTITYASPGEPAALEADVTLFFDTNGGSGSVASIRGTSGETVTLPAYTGTRYNYTFIGWTESRYASFPSTTYQKVYEAGSSYELTENKTLYAAWQSTGAKSTSAYFYIRLDGQIPYEPGSYEASAYTTGIQIKNAVTVQRWVVDVDTTKAIAGNHVDNDVVSVLNATPSDFLIAQVCSAAKVTYNPETQYILWYVQKYQDLGSTAVDENGKKISTSGSGWHIDGVLLERSKVTISYDANVPDGVTTTPDVPQGYQVVSGTTVKVGESGRVGGSMDRAYPSIAGYTFLGWNTKADGSGTAYSNSDQIVLNENMTLYAMWSKSGNMLNLNKVDGLGNALGGASFTLSGGSTSTSFTAGTYTNRNILTDTVYTITETQAPDNYGGLEASFSFIVSSQGGTGITAYFCNEAGNKLDEDPQNVSISYANGIVNITVTNIGYFYIFHTANVAEGVTIVEVPMIPGESGNWNADGTYNIVNETTEDFLYGGYYRDYGGKGSYNTPGTVPEDAVTYEGDQISWKAEDAYTDKGTAITPVVGTTYFLKEVPNTYLRPVTYIVYDTVDGNKIKKLYLMTATDDANYSRVGFNTVSTNSVLNEDGINAALYNKMNVTKDGEVYASLDAQTIFNVSGYLASSEDKPNYIVANVNYTEIPYFVTLDNVTVTGNQKLRVYLRNTTFQNWKTPGITKLAQKATISAN